MFTPEEPLVPINGVRNAASLQIFALGSLTLGGTITVGDVVKVTITGTSGTAVEYDYTMVKDDTLATAMTGLAAVDQRRQRRPGGLREYSSPVCRPSSWSRACPGRMATISRWR